jgi:hypothetical protein
VSLIRLRREAALLILSRVRTTYHYIQEHIQVYCRAEFTCSVTETKTTTLTFTQEAQFALDFVKALTLGVSGGYSEAKATATAVSRSFKPPAGVCGYVSRICSLAVQARRLRRTRSADVDVTANQFAIVPITKTVWCVQWLIMFTSVTNATPM